MNNCIQLGSYQKNYRRKFKLSIFVFIAFCYQLIKIFFSKNAASVLFTEVEYYFSSFFYVILRVRT